MGLELIEVLVVRRSRHGKLRVFQSTFPQNWEVSKV